MASMGTEVRVETDGEVVRVTLDGADRLNAQLPSTWSALARVREHIGPATRIIVVRGSGSSFSAGLDRRMLSAEGVAGEPSLPAIVGSGRAAVDDFIADAQSAFAWWRASPAISIAAVQGHAIGAGAQLALACDVVIASDDLRFAMPEATLGLIPDLAGTAPLVERVGFHRALDLCATGRSVDAEEALRIGLVEEVVPAGRLDDAVDRLVERLKSVPASALRALKPLLDGADRHPDQLARERGAQAPLLAHLVAQEDGSDGGGP